MEPLVSGQQLSKTKALVEDFKQGVGADLHQQLKVYARNANSYIEEYWDDAYLMQRSSITINTSPYLLLEADPDAPSQTQRAARLLTGVGSFMQRVRSRTMAPDMEKTALDMSQYDKVLAATRIPGLRRDSLRVSPNSRHAMVMVRYGFALSFIFHSVVSNRLRTCRNRIYTIDILDESGNPLSADGIQRGLEGILAQARSQPAGPSVGALTADGTSCFSCPCPLLLFCVSAHNDNANSNPLQIAQRGLSCVRSSANPRWPRSTLPSSACVSMSLRQPMSPLCPSRCCTRTAATAGLTSRCS